MRRGGGRGDAFADGAKALSISAPSTAEIQLQFPFPAGVGQDGGFRNTREAVSDALTISDRDTKYGEGTGRTVS